MFDHFQEVICGSTHKGLRNVQKNRAQTPFYTSPKERGPITRRIRAHTRGEHWQTQTQTQPINAKHRQTQSRRPKKTVQQNGTQDGPPRVQLHPWYGRTPSVSPRAQPCQGNSNRLPLVGLDGGGGNINAETSVCYFHMGIGNFPKNPLLFTYKRSPSPPHLQQHPRSKSYTTRASFQRGLGPS